MVPRNTITITNRSLMTDDEQTAQPHHAWQQKTTDDTPNGGPPMECIYQKASKEKRKKGIEVEKVVEKKKDYLHKIVIGLAPTVVDNEMYGATRRDTYYSLSKTCVWG